MEGPIFLRRKVCQAGVPGLCEHHSEPGGSCGAELILRLLWHIVVAQQICEMNDLISYSLSIQLFIMCVVC